jgi:hypothetical protein
LTVGAHRMERQVRVSDDPRVDLSPADRAARFDMQRRLAGYLRRINPVVDSVQAMATALDSNERAQRPSSRTAGEIRELQPLLTELRSRLMRLYNAVDDWPGRPTADQLAQAEYFEQWIARLEPRARAVMGNRR